MDGFGTITWWGFTPALDFQDEDLNLALRKLTLQSSNKQDELNILMLGAGDCRHILKTLARRGRHKHTKINLYVYENSMELYARHLMMVTVALEQQRRMGLQDKTELFLEIFGNAFVREQSIQYVEKMATEFIKMVTDEDYLEKKMPLIDMSMLKFKERDMLEGIFKFWRLKDKSVFNMEKCWDLRLRKYLGVRYDAIPGVFDWDYSMKLVEKGASIIHKIHYTEWRHHGQAFEIRDGNYVCPNKTLASGMVFKHEGERIARRGYWGDIVVSPYISLGIECEEQSFFKKANQQHTKTSVDVAEYNVMSLFHELATGTRFSLPEVTDKPDKQEATLTEITEEDEEEEAEGKTLAAETETEAGNPLDLEYEPLPMDDVKIHFLPLNSVPDLHKKSHFSGRFSFVYISNSLVHLLNPDLSQTFADTATVVLETAKFMLELKKEQQSEFVKKITSIARAAGCKESESPDEDNCHAEFIYQRTAAS